MYEKALKLHRESFKNILREYLDQIKATNSGEIELLKAIRYSLLSDGAKYIRSFLIYEAAKMLGVLDLKDIDKIGLAVEMLHCYSLIHDDLPAMDNADFRRNTKACHKEFTESTAILAGNALQVMAFDEISKISKPDIALRLIRELAKASGLHGILCGQVLDLNANFKSNEFEVMNYKKTGILFEFCLISAGILSGKEDAIESLGNYGKNFGIIYQMRDDLLDIGEDEYSYINHLKTNEELALRLQLVLAECEASLKGISGNEMLTSLPRILADRIY